MANSTIDLIDLDGFVTGTVTATYTGQKDDDVTFESDLNEGLDRETEIVFRTTKGYPTIIETRNLYQEGLREKFTDDDFMVADGGTFHVLKGDGSEPISESKAGDICFYDSSTDKKIIVDYDTWNEDPSKYPDSRYTPIGVVVVPTSHDVYGTGECGVISLVPMSYSTPDSGGDSEQTMYFGQNSTNTGLTRYQQIVYCGSTASPTDFASGYCDTNEENTYMPSDKFSAVVCPTDPNAYYDVSSSQTSAVPSPYLSDERRNSVYSEGDTSNVLSDFNGKQNTNTLIDLATSQRNWKTDSTITNNMNSGYSPAACCCWRYHTDGTEQGDWYLPTTGEMGYVIARFNKIGTTISSINGFYGTGVSLLTTGSYHASNQCTNTTFMRLFPYDGTVMTRPGSSTGYVRAFLRI